MDLTELTTLIKQQGDAWEKFVERYDARLGSFEEFRTALEEKFTRENRPMLGSIDDSAPSTDQWINTKTGQRIQLFEHKQRLAAGLATSLENGKQAPSLGRMLRGLLLGGRAPDAKDLEEERKALGISQDPAGGYTVSGILAAAWVDALRKRMVLSEAGARTMPMEAGEVSIARVDSDPAVSWHQENDSLAESAPTFGQLTMTARTVACVVKLSVELSQDSANIEQMLQSVLVGAMATAIDGAGLNGVGAGNEPTGIFNLSGRNTVTAIGTPTNFDFVVDGVYELLADNVPMERIGALIGHAKLWRKLRKLKTGLSGDQTPLVAPPEVAAMPKLWTTASPEGSAALGDWGDLIFGVRKQIQVSVLREAFMASNLQLAVVAYARVAFGAARKASFCTLEGITGL